ncbi:MAG TPA: carboxymuconolactone decarboxylase family protein [Pyrinomonadaceae bacterium]|jgi:AhpD family alkylhydroperoxidase|nr:carboxymuconolactone decarboxylase family protein [Pyrinomonadaceae bacterium]
MTTRSDYGKAAPGSVQAMYKLQEFSEGSGLERPLLELMKTRVSQINGCAFCIDVHTQDARAAGEAEQRLYGLSAWREAPYYSERERAALAWAEAVTNIPQIHESDEEYEAARAQFSAEELVKLTVVVIAINGWNRPARLFCILVFT